MTKEQMIERYKLWFRKEPSSLVFAQIDKLIKRGYTYMDISNAIWYTFFYLSRPNDLDVYGIHYVTKYIEESILFFNHLEKKRKITKRLVEEKEENKRITIKPQKQEIKRKEYDWENVE